MTSNAKDRDRALAESRASDIPVPAVDMDLEDDVGMDELSSVPGQDASGNKVIVIHPGSQTLRIGLASDALPKTVPMVIARRWRSSESEEDPEPRPKRMKFDDDSLPEPEILFGQEVCTVERSKELNC